MNACNCKRCNNFAALRREIATQALVAMIRKAPSQDNVIDREARRVAAMRARGAVTYADALIDALYDTE